MRLKMESGLLSVLLALSTADTLAQDNHDHGKPATKTPAHEFQFKTFGGHYVPVDCDLLGKDGALTSAFVKQMDLWRHLDDIEKRMGNVTEAQKIDAFEQHLQAHGITPEKIEKAATHCRENHL